MNVFCHRLDLGFEASTDAIDMVRKDYKDIDRSSIFNVKFDHLDPRIGAFLWQLGVSVYHVEMFYTCPGRFTQIHVDGPMPNDRCKLNWVYGAPGSKMHWYRDKPGSPGPVAKKTSIGTSYMSYDIEHCDRVFSAEVGTPSLVQVGTPHNVHNDTNEGRWCMSLVLKHPNTKSDFITWEQGERIFAPFVVH